MLYFKALYPSHIRINHQGNVVNSHKVEIMKSKAFCLLLVFLIPVVSYAGSITCRGSHYYPSDEELKFALAAASIGDLAVRSRVLGDGRLHLYTCASELRSKICSDGMIMGMFDKKASIIGGVTGILLGGGSKNSISSGALLGSGFGAATGMVNFTKCQKYLAEQISPIANRMQNLPSGSSADLKLFFDAIDRSSRGSNATIRSDEAMFLKKNISQWITNFNR